MFLDPDTRELLRTRPNPLTPEQALRLRGARPAGPPPRPGPNRSPFSAASRHRRDLRLPPAGPARPRHAGRTVTVHVSEHTLAIELDGETRTVRRTTTGPSSSSKAAGRTEREPSTDLSATAMPATEQHKIDQNYEPQDPYET